jgi:hypothetical protein
MMVDKLLMGFPQKAAGSNPAGGTLSTRQNDPKSGDVPIRYLSRCRWQAAQTVAGVRATAS